MKNFETKVVSGFKKLDDDLLENISGGHNCAPQLALTFGCLAVASAVPSIGCAIASAVNHHKYVEALEKNDRESAWKYKSKSKSLKKTAVRLSVLPDGFFLGAIVSLI